MSKQFFEYFKNRIINESPLNLATSTSIDLYYYNNYTDVRSWTSSGHFPL